MFDEIFALLCNIVSILTSNPIEDILLIFSACSVAVVFSSVMLARSIRRRLTNKSK